MREASSGRAEMLSLLSACSPKPALLPARSETPPVLARPAAQSLGVAARRMRAALSPRAQAPHPYQCHPARPVQLEPTAVFVLAKELALHWPCPAAKKARSR